MHCIQSMWTPLQMSGFGYFSHTCYFSTLWPRSVSLCGPPLRGWVVVAPRCFYVTITALTVDRGISSRAEKCHPMTFPCWKSLSSSVRPFYCQCLSMEIAWLCARFYIPVSNVCGWNSQIHKFEGVSTYFCKYNVFPFQCFTATAKTSSCFVSNMTFDAVLWPTES